MFAFVVSRILQAVPVLLVVGLIAYAMFAFVGDPVTNMLGQDYTEAQRVALVQQLGLDQPFFVQYGKFMWAALHGNFGVSYRLARPVMDLIGERLPATLELAFTAVVFAGLAPSACPWASTPASTRRTCIQLPPAHDPSA